MQRARYSYRLSLVWVSLVLVSLFTSRVFAQNRPQVPRDLQKFFVHYVDNRSISEKALNTVNLTWKDVGRSFALIAGVSNYPKMPLTDRELKPAAEDLRRLQEYLRTYEFFDEIVVLKDGHVTMENLRFFLQNYFPKRLKKFPKSRFLFAYSGHGMTEFPRGYLLQSTARNLNDKDRSINLEIVRVFIDEVVRSGHHVLVLLNACYSGAFLGRKAFGGPKRLIPRNPGAHAVTAGGTGEQTWHIPEEGRGSVFFEKVFAGLDGRADYSEDGLIGIYELFSYLKREVQISTDQDQNPQLGDLSRHGSKGEFFFLNRDRQVARGVLPEWRPEAATPFGIEAEKALIKGKKYYNAAKYERALSFFRESAKQGNGKAMNYLGYMYEKGLGVTRDYTESVRWYRKAANAGNVTAMNNLGYIYSEGQGVKRDNAEAIRWYRKAVDAGDINAIGGLGTMYDIVHDYAEAMRWYRKAADAGIAGAMHNIGSLYYNGKGVSKDYAEAMRWYRKAAGAGIPEAMLNIGVMYEYGQGVKRDYAEAMRWYRKAADAGIAEAMFNLGRMYSSGRGVKKDYAETRHWYRKAADAGYEDAIERLKELGEKR